MPNPEECAFAFKCQGDELIGFLHSGNPDCDIGVLVLVAGGPQYRAGVGRQLVYLGRRLAADGIAVMRFDHRGLGDSEGTFKGFRGVQNDIAAAIDEFKARAPHIRRLILWGGCDAGTSILINAHTYPDVVAVIAGNPFVSSPATSTKVARKHYLTRLMQVSFWKKVARMEYKVGAYSAAALRKVWGKVRSNPNQDSRRTPGAGNSDFLHDLLAGLQKFDGKVLFLMGDRFLLSDEFDLLVNSSREWQSAYAKRTHGRIDIKGGVQVFSTRGAQDQMFDAASDWIHGAFPDAFSFSRTCALPDTFEVERLARVGEGWPGR